MKNRFPGIGALIIEAPFSITQKFVLVHLPDNFAVDYLQSLESDLFSFLFQGRSLKGVVFDLSEVNTTDRQDLRLFLEILRSIKLLGLQVGICSINPGIAELIVKAQLFVDCEIFGSDIDDVLTALSDDM
jgi:anti-anti-sigma regulatory factor